ncbi:MAG: DUF2634 domain-containing protein [Chloroflexi bacterium]|nr:DUF2634 domain-containing protein [Chloroflexota bacterium]
MTDTSTTPESLIISADRPYRALSLDIALTSDGDIDLAANGDIRIVSGSDKLTQDIWKYLQTPPGDDMFNPNYGNALWGFLSQARPSDAEVAAALDEMTRSLAALKENESIERVIPLSEQINRIEDARIEPSSSPDTIQVSFTVVNKAGTKQHSKAQITR